MKYIFKSKNELDALENEIHELNKRLDALEKELKIMTESISVRQYANQCEIQILNFIFPRCRLKPYYILSFEDLLTFLSNPDTEGISGHLAKTAWNTLTEEERKLILNRKTWLLENTIDLNLERSINILKNIECYAINRLCFNVDELICYYQNTDDMDIVESLQNCKTFSEIILPSV